MRPTRHRVSLLFVYGGFHGWVTENHSGDDVAEADVDKRPYDVSVVEFVGQRDVAARINADNAPHAIGGTEEAAHRHRRPRIILDGTDYHAFCGCAD